MITLSEPLLAGATVVASSINALASRPGFGSCEPGRRLETRTGRSWRGAITELTRREPGVHHHHPNNHHPRADRAVSVQASCLSDAENPAGSV